MVFNWFRDIFVMAALCFYYYGVIICDLILKTTVPICIVHVYQDNKFVNVTWKYYLSKVLPYDNTLNHYYCSVYYSLNDVCYFTCVDRLPFKIPAKPAVSQPKRKQITLFHNNIVVNRDLNHIDNYFKNMNHISSEKLTDAKHVLQWLGYGDITHVKIITLSPFKIEFKKIDEVDISYFY